MIPTLRSIVDPAYLAGLAQGVPLRDGRLSGEVASAEGPRAFTLWEWVPGHKPPHPRDDALYHRFGAATAAFHEAAEGFPAPSFRDVLALVDDVLARLPEPEDRALVARLAAEAGRLDQAAENHRAADLTPVAATPHWPAFLAGYRTVRDFAAADVAAIPWLEVLLRVDYLHFHLYAKPAMRGTESLTEGWVEQNLTALRSLDH